MNGAKVDVLAVMDADAVAAAARRSNAVQPANVDHDESNAAWHRSLAARDAVAELIEAAKLALGEHTAPNDCYATGPLTGDPYLDLVRCPGCQLAAALARIGALS